MKQEVKPKKSLDRLLERLADAQSYEGEARLRQTVLALASLMVAPAGLIWGVIYLAFDEPLPAVIPLSYSALVLANLVFLRKTRWYLPVWYFQFFLILLLPNLLSASLGRIQASGAVILWSFICPLGAMLLGGRRGALLWVTVFLGLIVLGGALEPVLQRENNLPSALVTIFFVINIAGPSLIAVALMRYFVGQKDDAMGMLATEQHETERLLLNVLPKEIAVVLKNDNSSTIADSFPAVSVLFADVVGSTSLTVELSPRAMVGVLNEVFSYFDTLAEHYGVEKIRTIGDNYMVASGVPVERDDHAHALAAMALDMNGYIVERRAEGASPLQFRIGMNSGPVVAGVIGHKKFHYDIWGDAVNTASRMESHGIPGKIQIARPTYDLICEDFVCTPRGLVEIKGKGSMETWFLESRS